MMANGVKVKIYYIPGSHPCEAVFKAAELKGIDYKRVVVLPPAHRLQMTLGFGSRTVPAVKITDGPQGTEKIQTTRKILRAFESITPEPPLYPADSAQRERVIAAESWGDGEIQEVARRLAWAHLSRAPKDMGSFAEGEPVPLPKFVQGLAAPLITKIQMKLNNADDETVKADLVKLPSILDQVDQYIADGVIGGDQANAADLMIFASIWLMQSMDDLRPIIDARPTGAAATKVMGEPGGQISGDVLPAAWLAPLKAAAPAAT